MLTKLTCKNFMQADINGSPCSRILSLSHFSSFKYSLLDAKHAKSITNGNDWAFNKSDNAYTTGNIPLLVLYFDVEIIRHYKKYI